MKYLIALDIDGTILKNRTEMSSETIKYLKNLRKQGHIVTLITGRPYRSAKPIYDILELDTPIGTYNGSSLHQPGNDDFPKYSYKMDQKYVTETFSVWKDHLVNAFCEIEDKVYLFKEDSNLLKWIDISGGEMIIGNLDETIDHPLSGAIFFLVPNKLTEFKKYMNEKQKDNLGFRVWGSHDRDDYLTIELFTQFANKATSLEALKKHYDIPHERIIAIGDGSNDVEMLEYAYHSAAMGNASDLVKKAAKTVADLNSNDGAIKYLKTIIKDS